MFTFSRILKNERVGLLLDIAISIVFLIVYNVLYLYEVVSLASVIILNPFAIAFVVYDLYRLKEIKESQ
ncbi:hypothetical protein H0266_11030 [Halobacillus locisalis]|uniref:Uncharacterized protein n=1 Tax=Halobacillus locisalis TaxID=220753 RepID=A0A838CU50_9BACI|nr:hypothetical protein [Halobacillus locisalis]MBA2175428.1 hypothetical protein [Halobacillus locisalis]